ncbi:MULTISPECIES: DNA primase family protein [Bacillus]|jgi:putative DNA primase/helicase|uniref:DNA primase family protein n=1 Tax=Bacillus TaxID=1386 RepID=UPI001CCCC74F|nr:MULTISPECIES: phage/plasmid primase, P4 family [Bacillus]MCU4961690.1 phage/plasmid primase, P4 family [Bacillus paranthracis]MCU5166133.1 phage/plasmid primase, P4 family [Bacillus paranthracis]MDX5925992.1 phage/plasmid primase, P4 family [Bacillus cereus group sp. BfR-BA-00967]UBM45841.1 phage/plasmid primase, P4 family [Bacillus velezensis]HEF5700866.1 DNA primase [Bacillus paranthracis]
MKHIKDVLKKELSPFISPYTVRKLRLLEKSERTRKLLESTHLKEQLSMLITALEMIVGSESLRYFKAMLYGFNQSPQHQSAKIYESAGRVVEEIIPEELMTELQQLIIISKAEEHGFLYDEKKNAYTFNANVFAKQFISRCHVRSTKDGRLFLYHRKGVFEELSKVELGKVIRTLMHEGRRNSWNSKAEEEVVKALLRESNTVEEMNSNRNFINLKNGMLGLDSFELHPHHPSYLSTVQLPMHYDSNAVAPAFMQFLSEITLDDEELIRVHQEILGYLLSAETKAEKAFFFYGSGANGKSVLASIITKLVGKENVSSIPLAEFSKQFGLEGLINKTVNIAAENEMGGKALKTENFKAIVSGDTITINIKYYPSITYKPHCKLVFVVNNLPDSMDVTNGFFRKLMLLPFRRTFKPNERNVNLTQELLAELPGILNWAIEGLKRLRENNYQFSQCNVIEECHQTYYAEQNPVKEFFNEHVVLKEGIRTRQSDFHGKYLTWLTMQGIDDKGTKSKQNFWRNFKITLENECIPIVKKKVRGTIYYDGMEIVGLDNLQVPALNGEFIQF